MTLEKRECLEARPVEQYQIGTRKRLETIQLDGVDRSDMHKEFQPTSLRMLGLILLQCSWKHIMWQR